MKNLSKIRNLMVCASLCAFAPFVTSCSDDDEPNNSGNSGGSKYEAVDLGLSVKWATMNVGAEKASDYGDYYSWGETETKSSYTAENSVWYGVSYSSLMAKGVINSAGNLTSKYDVATEKWGGSWRMPTIEELSELVEKCEWTETTIDGHAGYTVTGPSGKSIFLPLGGDYWKEDLTSLNENGFYWSSTYDNGLNYAGYLECHRNLKYNIKYGTTIDGISVRPVKK